MDKAEQCREQIAEDAKAEMLEISRTYFLPWHAERRRSS